MISLVIVSHSKKISEGVVELCYEMVGEDLRIIPVGGTSDGRIGTDPILIKKAIEKAYDVDGVLIFTDIGSSIMSLELAIEMVEKNKGKDFYIRYT